MGRALQLTNILRDVGADAAIGRLYLPREGLEAHGIPITDPYLVVQSPGLDQLCQALAVEAEGYLRDAAKAIDEASRDAMRPAIIMMKVYRRILVRLQRRGWSPEVVLGEESPTARFFQKAEKLAIGLYYRYF